jgi:hypothetical protein
MAWTNSVLGNPLHRHRHCYCLYALHSPLPLLRLICSLDWIDYGFSYVESDAAWRTPIGIQLIFALIVTFVVFGLPESPRWLYKRGRKDETLEVLCAVHDLPPDDEYITSEMDAIRMAVELEKEEGAESTFAVFRNDHLKTGRRVMLAWFGLFMNQMSGINLVYVPNCPSNWFDRADEYAHQRLLPSHCLGIQRGGGTQHSSTYCWFHPAHVSNRQLAPSAGSRPHWSKMDDDLGMRRSGNLHDDDRHPAQCWLYIYLVCFDRLFLPVHVDFWRYDQRRSVGLRELEVISK